MDDLNSMLSSVLNDPESMQQIKELADMLGGGSAGNSTASPQTENDMPDLNMLMGIAGMLSSSDKNDKNSELLLALKPHLSDEKQQRVDKAVKLLKLYNLFITLRDSGMINNLNDLL